MNIEIYKKGNDFTHNGSSQEKWGELLSTNHRHFFELVPEKFYHSYKFSLPKTVQLTHENIRGTEYWQLLVDLKISEDKIVCINYRADRPFCRATYLNEVICSFLTVLQWFEDVEDAKFIFGLEDPIEYQEDELLQTLQQEVAIFVKYYKPDDSGITVEIRRWLDKAFNRFDYTMKHPSQDDVDSNIAKMAQILNNIGFILVR